MRPKAIFNEKIDCFEMKHCVAFQEQLNKVSLEKNKLQETIDDLQTSKLELESELDKVINNMQSMEEKLQNGQAITTVLQHPNHFCLYKALSILFC